MAGARHPIPVRRDYRPCVGVGLRLRKQWPRLHEEAGGAVAGAGVTEPMLTLAR